MTERERMMRKVQMYCFAGVDANLFLDSHPTNQAALAYHRKNKELFDKAVAEYEAKFGPLYAGNNQDAALWTWTQDPWPWEGAAN